MSSIMPIMPLCQARNLSSTPNMPPTPYSAGSICRMVSFFTPHIPHSYTMHTFLPNVELYTMNLSTPTLDLRTKTSLVTLAKNLMQLNATNAPPLIKHFFTDAVAEYQNSAKGFPTLSQI